MVHGVTEAGCLGVELGNNVIDPSESGFLSSCFSSVIHSPRWARIACPACPAWHAASLSRPAQWVTRTCLA